MGKRLQNTEVVDVVEAAKILNISPATLRKWVEAGEVKAILMPLSGQRRFQRTELQRKREALGYV